MKWLKRFFLCEKKNYILKDPQIWKITFSNTQHGSYGPMHVKNLDGLATLIDPPIPSSTNLSKGQVPRDKHKCLKISGPLQGTYSLYAKL